VGAMVLSTINSAAHFIFTIEVRALTHASLFTSNTFRNEENVEFYSAAFIFTQENKIQRNLIRGKTRKHYT